MHGQVFVDGTFEDVDVLNLMKGWGGHEVEKGRKVKIKMYFICVCC